MELLHCLFAVSAADESISSIEEERIRQIARELGFGHRDYIAARSEYSHLREVMKGLPKEEIKLIFVNNKRAGFDTVLKDGDQVALAPPVGGM